MEELDILNLNISEAKRFVEKRIRDEASSDTDTYMGKPRKREPKGVIAGLVIKECMAGSDRLDVYHELQKYNEHKHGDGIYLNSEESEEFSNPIVGHFEYARLDEQGPANLVRASKNSRGDSADQVIDVCRKCPHSTYLIVTGVIDISQWERHSVGHLHTWIESAGEVIDVAHNLVMPTTDYYKLFDVIAFTKHDASVITSYTKPEDITSNVWLLAFNHFLKND